MRRLTRGTTKAVAWAVAVLLLIQLAACAASKKEEPATAAKESAPADAAGMSGAAAPPGQQQYQQMPSYSISSATDDLDRAEKELELALGDKDAAGQPLATGDRCTVVCKALASMRRSADQICGIDASRCTDARARVSKAEERAKDACPACATPT